MSKGQVSSRIKSREVYLSLSPEEKARRNEKAKEWYHKNKKKIKKRNNEIRKIINKINYDLV